MNSKSQISAFQMGLIMYPTIVITAILLLPTMLAEHAHRDLWLSPIWASCGGVWVLWMFHKLHAAFPNETVIQFSEHIVGPIPGKIIGLVVILFYLQLTGYIIREFGEFLVTSFFPRTPLIVVMSSVAVVSAYAVRGGIEVLGRCASVFAPIVLLLFLLLVLLLIPNLEPRYFFPVMENGVAPSLIGAIIPMGGWFGEFFLVTFLFPLLKDKEKGLKWGVISLLAVVLTMVITNLVTLFLYGDLVERIMFPVMQASRYIQYVGFVEHVEAVVMAVWILGAFVKISMFLYAVSAGTSQWLKLSDYRLFVFPLGLISVLLSVWSAHNLQELNSALGTSGPFYFATVQYLIPILLTAVAYIRVKRRSSAS